MLILYICAVVLLVSFLFNHDHDTMVSGWLFFIGAMCMEIRENQR